MKKNLALFIVFMLLASLFVLPANAANDIEIIFSENFEGDMSRWVCESYRNTVTMDKESDDSYINRHLLLKNGSFPNNRAIPEVKSEMIDILPNTIYTLAVDLNADHMQKINVHFFTKTGSEVGVEKIFVTTEEPNEWGCFSYVLKTPKEAEKLRIGLTKRDDAYNRGVRYDNVILCKGRVTFETSLSKRKKSEPFAVDNSETVLAPGVVFYDTFEDTTGRWSYEDEDGKWKYINDKSKSRSDVSMDDSITGKACLLVADDDYKYSIGVESIKFDAIADAEYTLSFSARHKSQDSVDISLKFFDETNKQLANKTVTTNKNNNKWHSYETTLAVPAGAKTAQVRIVSNGNLGENFIDNLKVVSSIIPEKKEESENTVDTTDKYDEIIKNSMILSIGLPNALVKGEKKLIDETNDKVVADIVDSRTLVPVRFIASNYGADVLWDAPTKTVTLKFTDKTASVVLDNKEIKIDDKIITIDVPAQSIEGRTMLPLRAFIEQVMGKVVFWDARGLIIITDEAVLDAQKDAEIINKIFDNIKNG